MKMIVKMVNGETLSSDEESFQDSLDMLADNDMITQTPQELAMNLMNTITQLMQAISNGVTQMGALQIKIDGVQTHINTSHVNYMQIDGVEEWLADAVAYGDKVFED